MRALTGQLQKILMSHKPQFVGLVMKIFDISRIGDEVRLVYLRDRLKYWLVRSKRLLSQLKHPVEQDILWLNSSKKKL